MTGAVASVNPGRPLRPSDPTVLGPYSLLRRLGEGGMGSVYLARRDENSPLVAIKMIRKDLLNDPDFRRRFRSEVARAQQVPAFCTAEVLDADSDHEPPYLVVEFVNGPSLARVVQNQGPLSPANLHGLAIGVATALTAIHGAGVIHRDLKPANVLLAPGAPKVIDFGIARAAEGTGSDTAPHQLMGTIPYMAPERLDPDGTHTITPAADIFAWGAVVAYAGTGRVPFGGGSAEAVARILTQPPDLTGLTGPLRDLVSQALSKNPRDRPTARDLLDHLVAGGPRQTQQRLIEAATEQAVVTVSNVSDPTRLASAPISADQAPSLIENALNEPKTESRERKPGWAMVPMLTLAVIMLTAAVVGILTGLIKPGIFGAPSDSPSQGQSPAPTGSTSVSASQSAGSPTVSPSVTVPVFPSGGVALVNEQLTLAGDLFQNHDDQEKLQSTCVHTNSGYQVRSSYGFTYRCGNQLSNEMFDIAVEVEVSLRDAKSCAAIWFRYLHPQGYQLSICPTGYALFNHRDTEQEELGSHPMAIKVDQTFRVGIVLRGDQMSFFHNGVYQFSAKDGTYLRGRVGLGVGLPIVAKDPAVREVLYRNVKIWTLPSSQP